MIRIDSASRAYGSFWAVSDVSLSISKGEVVGLLGHNGAGKSTLMRMLAGVIEPSAGTLSIAGHDVVHARTQAQAAVGYLPESAPLYPDLAVLDYLEMMAELRGVPADQAEAALKRAVDIAGLKDRIGQRIGSLSKGFRQRVGLAQAIVHRPPVLIMDEPTNGLDPQQILGMRALIRTLAEDATVLVSTHILQEVEAVCDRVVVLIDGRLVADAPLTSLLGGQATVLTTGAELQAVTEAYPAAQLLEERDGLRRVRLPETDSEAVLADALVRQWRVVACAPERRTLEDVFRELQGTAP